MTTTDSSVVPPVSGAGSSSAPREPGAAVAADAAKTPPHPPASQVPSFIEKWGVTILSMALTGVIGYFSAILMVRDDIAKNREAISVLRADFTNHQQQVSDLKGMLRLDTELAKDLAVLQSRMDGIDARTKK